MISIASFYYIFQTNIQIKETGEFHDNYSVIKSWEGEGEEEAIALHFVSFFFVAVNLLFRDGVDTSESVLIRLNLPAMSAYTVARTHTCVCGRYIGGVFSRRNGSLRNVKGWEGYCRRGAKVEDLPDTSLAYVFDLLSRQIHSRLHTAVFTRLNEALRKRSAIQDRDFEAHRWARPLQLALYVAGMPARLNREKREEPHDDDSSLWRVTSIPPGVLIIIVAL